MFVFLERQQFQKGLNLEYKTARETKIELFFTKVIYKLGTRESCDKHETQPPEVFCNKSAFRNFAKFTRKHLC